MRVSVGWVQSCRGRGVAETPSMGSLGITSSLTALRGGSELSSIIRNGVRASLQPPIMEAGPGGDPKVGIEPRRAVGGTPSVGSLGIMSSIKH